MKFLLDHDVPETIARTLARAGHQVERLRDLLAVTVRDDEVLEHAYQQESVLLTCNRDDFLLLAKNQPHSGIIVVIRRRSRAAESAAVIRLLRSAGELGIAGNVNFA